MAPHPNPERQRAAAGVEAAASHFAVDGALVAAEPFGTGHIHDSYRLTWRGAKTTARFLLQRINEMVFPRPAEVMENIARVTAHMAQRLQRAGAADAGRRVPMLVRTRDGGTYYRDRAGACWRMFRFIEGTRVYEAVRTPAQAEQAGRAFGRFQSLLADFAGPRLHETIPGFHDTLSRFASLDHAVQADSCNRAGAARAEIEVANCYRPLASALLDLQRRSEIPERVVHNDAKISNVLFDQAIDEALCVVDFDTVMPGLSLFDFGDMVRSMTCRAAEDEVDLAKVAVELPLFEGLARGYLATAGAFLTPAERANLVVAGKVITLEQAVRFLTDFLAGDPYYKTHRPSHNLDRCRTQLKLVKSIEQRESRMSRLVERP
jgi:aminoglycoside phosphotransferase (APT) family kinase protein